ncbi:hypothetical protein OV203_48490 [Nannocystis sp. ILAH1]|uniref:hypothetical protein n=1 Tax=unclassified Nannocystis TaxID=2627009 RepID=UPI00226EA183|nr:MULTISPECIES: hypothetical protein [unclassified Nannocystis]MCY0995061.1 hypothetical protein [Nannocystis sp. ILAH1]MCY1069735.1 hypothetical protein [Nannocystis sp. RBIL2]
MYVRLLASACCLALGLLVACGDATQSTSEAGDPSGPATTGGLTTGVVVPPTSTTTSTGSSGVSVTTTDGLEKYDLPDDEEVPGCGAVDVLFVVDNSKSMAQYQSALADAFPQFVDAMIDNLPKGVDLHVGITTTDFYCTGAGQACCPDNCPVGNTQCQIGTTPEEVEAIDQYYLPPTSGDNGANGSQGRLFVHDGMAYFATSTDVDPAPLKAWFTGAATAAGEQGSSLEMPVAAAAYATSATNAAANEGFLRDKDAVLLVFFLTNDPDASLEVLSTYTAMVRDAKADCGGDACILTAGLIKKCVPAENQKLWQFMKAFGEEPIWGDIEDKAGYVEIVGEALAATLGDACIHIPIG